VANGWWGMFNTKGDEIALRRAVLPFYELWGGHLRDKLVASEVERARRGFDAPPTGGQPPAEGSVVVKPAKIEDAGLGSMNFAGLKAEGVEASGSPETLSSVRRPLQIDLRPPSPLSKGRLRPLPYKVRIVFRRRPQSAPNATLGLSLIDARGWDKTQSGMAVDAIEKDKDWTAHSGDSFTRRDCPGVSVFFRAPGVGAPVYGTLEVRNLRVECWELGPASRPTKPDRHSVHLEGRRETPSARLQQELRQGDRKLHRHKGFTALSAKSWTASNEKTDSLD
jgi:alpha-N-arabinofuranosidase